jgi:uncharacterized protein YigA (DUF484 family)
VLKLKYGKGWKVKHSKELVMLQMDKARKRIGSRELEIEQLVEELSRNTVVSDGQRRGRKKRRE